MNNAERFPRIATNHPSYELWICDEKGTSSHVHLTIEEYEILSSAYHYLAEANKQTEEFSGKPQQIKK